MATRLYTNFDVQDPESFDEMKRRYFIDVSEDYDTVFQKIYPLNPPTSNLEAQACYHYTKPDGGRFACHPGQIISFEELVD